MDSSIQPRVTRGKRRSGSHSRLLKARDRLLESYSHAIGLEDLARAAGLSPFHFLREFRRTFGETPHSLLQRVRLERACDGLARGSSVTEVCFEVGYSSLGSFSSLFARRYGRSPTLWQRELRRVVVVPEALSSFWIPGCFLDWFTHPVLPSSNSREAAPRTRW
jgi:AraC-like DNA-binding protein